MSQNNFHVAVFSLEEALDKFSSLANRPRCTEKKLVLAMYMSKYISLQCLINVLNHMIVS